MGNQHIEVSGDPIPQEVLDYCASVTTTEREFAREKKAYLDFCERHSKERDAKKRMVMENFLQYLLFSKAHGMKPSYALTEALNDSLRQEAQAKRAIFPLSLHEEIAEILTTATYTIGRGRSTNWTIYTTGSESLFSRESREPFGQWTAGEVMGSFVKFGSHHFAIGNTTQRILSMLEARYDIDFKQLEKDRKSRLHQR
ncbi:hypothetical protein GOC80_13315 [Sinorhizobium medicae]|nr:hypothetical protein [Sinorhizobium medicae]